MMKDFVSIMDLMPEIFKLAKRDITGFFNVRRYPSRGELYQYHIQTTDSGQKQLLFVDRRYDFAQKYEELTGEKVDDHYRRGRRDHIQYHAPYVLGQAYDVPEILEVHYLRHSPHIEYITEEYLQVLENLYYQYVLAFVRSLDQRDRIDTHTYDTDKGSNIIYREINQKGHLFQLDPDDDNFAETVKDLVCEKAEKLSKVKKTTKSDKNKLAYILFPSRDLDDLLDYDEGYSGSSGYLPSRTFSALTQYLPMLILHVAIAQERQTYVGSSYPEYQALVKNLPRRISRQTQALPDDWSIQDELDKHLTLSPDRNLYVVSYGHGVGLSASYHVSFHETEYVDSKINQAIFTNVLNQIRFMMFGHDDVPVPVDDLPAFENESWREDAGLRLSLNASSLDWSEQDE